MAEGTAAAATTSNKRTSSPSPSTRPAKVPKRKSHVSRACNACRRRKSKCDAMKPKCSTCSLYNDECHYTTEQDGRKPVTKPYVDALKQRIKVLETLLRERGIDELASLTESQPLSLGLAHEDRAAGGSSGDLNAEPEDEDSDSFSVNDFGINRLKIDDDTGELRQYGPTSAFMHLPEPSVSSSSASMPLNATPLGASSPYSTSSPEYSGGTDFDWSRNLPVVDGFHRDIHDELIDMFFAYFNSWCYWVEPTLFKRDVAICLSFSAAPPLARTSQYSGLLHNAILSLAANYSDRTCLGSCDKGAVFASEAKRAIDSEAESPMLSTVVGLMLLGSYHSGTARHGLGYMYAGMGLRMSQTLGLGIDCSKWIQKRLITESFKDDRDHTYYMCYIQDKLWGFYVGRSPTLKMSEIETPFPSVNKERDAALWMPVQLTSQSYLISEEDSEEDPDTMELQDIRIPSWASTNFLWTCKLAYIAERVADVVYHLRAKISSARTQNLVSDLDIQLEKWYADLPEGLVLSSKNPSPPHVIMLHAMYYFVVILLHRPFYLRGSSHGNEFAVSRCSKASSRIVQLLDLYRECPGLRYAPITLTQITFTAGTSHLLGAVTQGNGRTEKQTAASLEGAKTCLRALQEMGHSWQCATQSGEILSRLLVDWCPESKSDPPDSEDTFNRTEERGRQQISTSDLEWANDPSSDIAKALVSLGWTPPTMAGPTAPATSVSFPLTPMNLSELSTSTLLQNTPSFVDHLHLNTAVSGSQDIGPDSLSQMFSTASSGQETMHSSPSMWPLLGPGYTWNWTSNFDDVFMRHPDFGDRESESHS
ncbi:fungal-specific transcription factor domain-containing protein [Desarmillaria tabescens]|uniref:Fungal-specific transcription factor domain-containing protein n=1 Tax=Armillaria tabescens TaxID=1929756 RepID=A0AA39KAP4_ARMTA|nr:fungal-specific transcription factor domain-containing protein [Desarmillaria tabescens]KAK0457686.1 fungal-specific transcription factor domain-containing protein [Desarmillaria tabescens]